MVAFLDAVIAAPAPLSGYQRQALRHGANPTVTTKRGTMELWEISSQMMAHPFQPCTLRNSKIFIIRWADPTAAHARLERYSVGGP